MSIQHVNHVIEHSKAKGTAKLVLLLIANHADEMGIAWPSISRLTKQANVDKSNVKKAIKTLCESGDLTIVGQGMHGVNRYQITVKSRSNHDQILDERGGDSAPSEGEGVNTPGGRIRTGGGCDSAPSLGVPAPPKSSRTINEPSDIRTKPDLTEQFERFWNAYPKRDGSNPKKPAFQKFKIACRKVPPENLIQSAKQYADEIDREEEADRRYSRKFVAQATTWLNQERWESYPVEDPDDLYRMMLRKNRELNVWPAQWGPQVGEPGCEVPPHVLAEFGLVGVLQ